MAEPALVDDPRGRALALMQSALPLLDEAHEDHAAVHLQHAISIAGREPSSPVGRLDRRAGR